LLTCREGADTATISPVMNPKPDKTIISHSDHRTEDIAETIARRLIGGEVLELVADLGGGKTTFVRGLARGIGSNDHVSSPSFTISNQYMGNKLELVHFDFYRLEKAGEMEKSLVEFFGRADAVVVIEWADIIKQVLPSKRLSINFRVVSEHARELSLTYPKTLAYLVKGL
jgi:tRNA threonylcarbamoyladenosine biosynthesis protein TsaE